jgi:uncharacterized protein
MGFQWDPAKAEANFEKHRIRFSEVLSVFSDDFALTAPDDESDPGEQRFVSIGAGAKGRILVVVWCWRKTDIRIISARKAGPRERAQYEEQP